MGFNIKLTAVCEDYSLDKKANKRYGFRDKGSFWSDKYLWEKAKDLPVIEVPVEDFLETKIGWKLANVLDVSSNVKRILDANLDYPIILRSDGLPMDGYHRICKAVIMQQKTIKCKKFEVDPPPEGKVVK